MQGPRPGCAGGRVRALTRHRRSLPCYVQTPHRCEPTEPAGLTGRRSARARRGHTPYPSAMPDRERFRRPHLQLLARLSQRSPIHLLLLMLGWLLERPEDWAACRHELLILPLQPHSMPVVLSDAAAATVVCPAAHKSHNALYQVHAALKRLSPNRELESIQEPASCQP